MPFIPQSSEKIFTQLGLNEDERKWDTLKENNIIKNGLTVIEKGEPLFMRLDTEAEVEFIKGTMKV